MVLQIRIITTVNFVFYGCALVFDDTFSENGDQKKCGTEVQQNCNNSEILLFILTVDTLFFRTSYRDTCVKILQDRMLAAEQERLVYAKKSKRGNQRRISN